MLKRIISGLFAILFTACATSLPASQNQPSGSSPEPTDPGARSLPYRASLKNLGPAPELANEIWLNTEQPLRLAGLRGSVVLLDMWTFG